MTVYVDSSGRRITVPGLSGGADQAHAVGKSGRDPTLIRLSTEGGAAATIYPALGFNCIDLRLRIGERIVPVIHSEPDVLAGGSPTHNGIPILFPWPNRIAESRYEWDGTDYQLTANDPDGRHCLHGFACDTPWTRFQPGDADEGSCVTGVFRISEDAPAHLGQWPGDLVLTVTFALTDQALKITSTVSNPDDHPVPFGLGFHPYFSPPGAGSIEECGVWVDAHGYWRLEGCIPTREVLPVDRLRDFRSSPELGDRQLDDVLTDLSRFYPGDDGLMDRARLVGGDFAMVMRCDSNWRDIVVFTPANRASFAIEPYTCPTDAIHMTVDDGRDVGWRVLDSGESWTGVVEFRVDEVAANG
ncbi:MAG: hypothetical protein U0904_08980 [Candidatus Nanopelagicales bacterium]|nr:hypothetical protein [Candidatus Nanopelagicales bacterium]